MATIKLQRTNEFLNSIRDYKIFIDGNKVGDISEGETMEFEVSAGQHTIISKIDWCSSQELSFVVNEIETNIFSIGGFKNGNWLIPVSLAILGLHIILKYNFEFYYTIFLIVPAFLLLVYYLTIGHKNYLTLTEF